MTFNDQIDGLSFLQCERSVQSWSSTENEVVCEVASPLRQGVGSRSTCRWLRRQLLRRLHRTRIQCWSQDGIAREGSIKIEKNAHVGCLVYSRRERS